MIRKMMTAAAVALVMVPAAAAASECRTRAMAGTWFLGSGSDLICQLVVRRNGNYTATCPVLPGGESAGSFSGSVTLNGGCVLRGLIGDELGFEGRAWATATPSRIDVFQVVLDWKVEEGTLLMSAAGHRRPNVDPLPLD